LTGFNERTSFIQYKTPRLETGILAIQGVYGLTLAS
jgi:hypothetical protein